MLCGVAEACGGDAGGPSCADNDQGIDVDLTDPRQHAPILKKDNRGVVWTASCEIFLLKNACEFLSLCCLACSPWDSFTLLDIVQCSERTPRSQFQPRSPRTRDG